MKKIFVIAGHSNSDPGAKGKTTTEAVEAIKLRDSVIAKIDSKYTVLKDNNDDNLRDVIKKVNQKANKGDILLSIHFNAFNKKATGSLLLVYHNSKPSFKLISKDFVKEIANTIGTNNRGLGYENSGAHSRLAILNDTITQSMLLEVCFIDNLKDFKAYEEHRKEVEDIIVKYLENLANE